MYKHFFKRLIDFIIVFCVLVVTISPFRTFISWGNSSIEVERTKRPTFVNRSASGSKLPSASRSSVMVLNLITLNTFPPFPGRSCMKKAPVPLLAKCNHKVTTNNIGQITTNTQKTMIKSINRLKKCLVGRFVRSTSIDELPQLINVLKGDMALIGPRPLLVQYLPLYSKEQARRHDVRPGITGWAQVNGRNAINLTYFIISYTYYQR